MKKSLLFCGLLSLLSGFAFAVTPTAPASKASAPTTNDTKPPISAADLKPVVLIAKPEQPINCLYKMPPKTAHVDPDLVQKWSEKAAQQSFDFDPAKMTEQLSALKACYTEQGWQSFYDALQKSGNIKAIQSQHLMVSSLVDGQIKVTEAKDNQWKVSMPLQVVYQNENEKLTQNLTVDLLVGRKPTGDLGIMQIIASPRQEIEADIKADSVPAASKKP
ncbi:DotI/IcmL family type IV secretion protein [Legionella sp. CNM-4043-24]|uniref:DotI/IcmL family type IV secretion protein n=1 Tax=Legionella sp. CNM-4043-24 TaxID=3421646 RepID=UPI00403B00D1